MPQFETSSHQPGSDCNRTRNMRCVTREVAVLRAMQCKGPMVVSSVRKTPGGRMFQGLMPGGLGLTTNKPLKR